MEHIASSCLELTALKLDYRGIGTRFRIFPQPPFLPGFEQPETVWVSTSPAEITPGPADPYMLVVDAIDKAPYEFPFAPPFDGPINRPAQASPDGHFDSLQPGTHAFEAANMYGTLRWILDRWEAYFGARVEWYFRADYPRLELIPWVDWDNAQSGYGFIEVGYREDDQGQKFPMNLNFDVLAHELGHTMLYSIIGFPGNGQPTTSFLAFHESASDLVAVVSLLHFDSIVDLLLERTAGDLYPRNILNRIGEVSPTKQIRLAGNHLTMADIPDPATAPEQLSQRQRHDISLPLTGAVFDLLVEVFQQNLVDAGLITAQLDSISRRMQSDDHQLEDVHIDFRLAYEANKIGFKQALTDARDYLGWLLAYCWRGLTPELHFSEVLRLLLEADKVLARGHYQIEIAGVFASRGIFLSSDNRAQ